MAVREQRKQREKRTGEQRDTVPATETARGQPLPISGAIRHDRTRDSARVRTQAVTVAQRERGPPPPWGGSRAAVWMYTVPENDAARERWTAEWGEYLLDWARHQGAHVVSLGDFIIEREFGEIHGKIEAFRLIGDWLVGQGVAEWMDEEKRRLRVYWRSVQEWAEVIYAWALRRGERQIDVKTLVIQCPEETFSSLPEEELHRALQILVEDGLAEWLDKKRHAITLRL